MRDKLPFLAVCLSVVVGLPLGSAYAADVLPPEEVVNLMVSRSGDDIVLSWDGVTTNILGGPESVVAYQVYRGGSGGFVPDKVGGSNAVGSPAGTGFTDPGAVLDPGQLLVYRVSAVDTAGNEGNTKASLITAPPALNGSFSTTAAELDWAGAAPPASIGGYEVVWGTSAMTYDMGLDVGNVATRSIFPLLGGVSHYFAVLAYDSARNLGQISNEIFGQLLGGGIGTEVCGRIDASTIFTLANSPYTITCDVEVYGDDGPFGDATGPAILSIEPGVVLKFEAGTGISFGNGASGGALAALGTSASPIVFTGTDTFPLAGAWDGITFNDAALDSSIIQWSVVEFGGLTSGAALTFNDAEPTVRDTIISDSPYRGITLVGTSSPTIERVTIRDVAADGIYVPSNDSPDIQGSTFSGIGGYAVYFAGATDAVVQDNSIEGSLYFASALGNPTVTGNTFNNYGSQAAQVGADDVGEILATSSFYGTDSSSRLNILGEQVATDATWSDPGFPLVMTSSSALVYRDLQSPATLTIEPGVEVRFNSSTYLQVGSGANRGALIAQGTPANPILFTTNDPAPAPGQWSGILFEVGSEDGTSILRHCVVEYAGQAYLAGVRANASAPTIQDCTIRQSSAYGIYGLTSASPVVQGNVFSGNANFDVYISGASSSAISGNSFTNSVFFATAGDTYSVTGNTFDGYDDSTHNLRVGAHAVDAMQTNTFNGIGADSAVEILGETLAADATWADLGFPYQILGSVTVANDTITPSTLTIDPGVNLRFNGSTSLQIGTNALKGALIAQGTAGQPILFTTNNASPAPGQWQGILFEAEADDATSVLQDCVVEYAGLSYNGNIRTNGSSPTIRDCTLRHSSVYGIYNIGSGSPTIQDNIFSNNADYDVYSNSNNSAVISGNTFASSLFFATAGTTYSVTGNTFNGYDDAAHPIRIGAHAVATLPTNTFNGTGVNSVVEILGETLAVDSTWANLGFPYRVVGVVTVANDTQTPSTLTISPGTTLKFNSSTRLEIGTASLKGALVAQGTVPEPIVFTTSDPSPAPGQWQSVYFFAASDDATSIMENCVVEYGGQTYSGNVRLVTANPTIRNCTIRQSSVYGIYGTASAGPTVEDSIFTDNTDFDIYLNGASDAAISGNSFTNSAYFNTAGGTHSVTGNTFENYDDPAHLLRIGAHAVDGVSTNTFNGTGANSAIEVHGGTLAVDATWSKLGFPYRILTNITIANDVVTASTLTINPGSTLQFDNAVSLLIGTSTNIGALIAQGTPAEPITFTTSNASPAPGQWRAIYFDSASDDATSILENCVVEYGGQTYSANVRLVSADPTIRDCTIRHSSVYGVYGTTSAGPVVEGNTFIDNADYDVYLNGASDAALSGNTFNSSIYFVTAGGTHSVTGNTFENYDDPARNLRVSAHAIEGLSTNTFNGIGVNSRAEILGETLALDATWGNLGFPYQVVGNVTIANDTVTAATLTIDPGTTLMFNASTALLIASGANRGALIAQGTVAEPIVFTTSNASPAPGQWRSVYFADGTDDATSIMENCVVEYGGQTDTANIRLVNADPTIHGNTIRHSSVYGIYGSGPSSPIVDGNTFSNNVNFDVYMTSASDAILTGNTFTGSVFFNTAGGTHTVTGNTFDNYDDPARLMRVGAHAVGGVATNVFNGTGANSLVEILGETVAADATWGNLGFPYRILGNTTFASSDPAGATLTIDPGATLQFNSSSGLFIGTASDKGALIAQGTVPEPITFTTSNDTPAPGQWRSVYFANGADDATSLMENCIVEYGGQSDSGNVRLVTSSPTIRNCTISNGNVYGIYGTAVSSPVVEDNIFSQNTNFDLLLSGGSDATVTGNTFETAVRFDAATGQPLVQNNTFDSYVAPQILRIPAGSATLLAGNVFNGTDATSAIELIGRTMTGDHQWGDHGIPYVVITANVTVAGTLTIPTRLTIDPGVTVRFDVGRTLTIASSSTQGELIAQGTVVDPITFTSNAAVPAAGDWFGIVFNDGTTFNSVLENIVVEYAGRTNGAGIWLDRASVPISDSIVRDSGNYGIYVTNASPTLTNVEVQNTGNFGIYLTGSATRTPTVTGSTISAPGNYGIYNFGAISSHITGNTVDNGIFFSAVGGLPIVQNNIINDYDLYPLQIGAAGVGNLTGNTFNDTLPGNAVLVLGETLANDATWSNLSIPYRVTTGVLTIAGSPTLASTLTLDPGVVIQFDPSRYINVGVSASLGALVASGTPAEPIVFTTSNPAPAPGQWGGIYFNGTTVDATTILDHTVLEYGGSYNDAIVNVSSAAPTILNSTIRYSSANGILSTSSSPTIAFNDIVDNTVYGVDIRSTLNLTTVHHNNFIGNGSGALTRPTTGNVDARFNWFGDASGPSGNGPGAGQGVTANVSFSPWLGTPFTTDNYFPDLFDSTPIFMPGSFSRFDGEIAQDSTWTLQLFDTGDTLVRTINGSGTDLLVDWDGNDDFAAPLADGPYRYRFDATGNATSDVAAPLIGMVDLDQTFAVGEVVAPAHLQTVNIGTLVTVDGTAAGSNFTDYVLQYGLGLFPTSYTNITSSSSPITTATLGTWDTTGQTGGIYSLRLLVNNDMAEQTIVNVGTFVLSINNLAVDTPAFSPNGDGVIDEVTASSMLSIPADWTLDVVDTSGPTVIRTYAGTGLNVNQTWNGTLADNTTIAPEGDYRFDLTATKNGGMVASSSAGTELDVTPPVASISLPTPGTNIFGVVDIIGDANDPSGSFQDYVIDYGIGGAPLSFTTISSNSVEVTGGVLGSWATNDAEPVSPVANGAYQVRLTSNDLAGNMAVDTLQVTLDNLQFGNVATSATTINTSLGEIAQISFSLNKPANVTMTIHDETPGAAGPALKTIGGSFPPGNHALTWDGTDDSLIPLSDEAYVYVLDADAGSGRTDRYAPSGGLGVGSGSGTIDTAYDPYTNDFWTMVYNNLSGGRVTMQVTPSGGTVFDVFTEVPSEVGSFLIEWDGRDDTGQIIDVASSIYFPPPVTLRPNYIVTTGDKPRFAGIHSDPYMMRLSYGDVTRLQYDVLRDADVTVTILPPGIADPSDPSAIVLLSADPHTAGSYEIEWDGVDPGDPNENLMEVVEEGAYTYVIEGTNPTSGSMNLARGVINVFR